MRLRSRLSAHTPAGSAEHGERQELRGRHQRHLGHATADGEHRERQHHHRDPVAEDGEHLAAEQQPVLRLVAQHRRHREAPP